MAASTVFSAFSDLPEMKGKPLVEQRRLVRQAARRRGDALWFIPMLTALAAAAVWAGVAYGIARIVIDYKAARSPTGQGSLSQQLAGMLVVAGFLVFFLTYALMRRSMVLRSLLFIVNKAGCPYCQFSLVGLKPESLGGTGAKPVVRCPECGELVAIFDHGIMIDDLLTEREKRRPLAGAGPSGAYRPEITRYGRKDKGRARAGTPPARR
jgi:hypothetical protein